VTTGNTSDTPWHLLRGGAASPYTHFLIPLVATLHLVIRRYGIEGFSIASKLSEKNSRVDPSLAGGYISASTTCKKKGRSYPSHINTPISVLKMLY
jgi:hypothetical protein